MAPNDKQIRTGQPILAGTLLVFAIIEGGITSWLVSQFNSHHNSPNKSISDRTRFLVFVSWWTVVFATVFLLAYLSKKMTRLTSIGGTSLILFPTWVFWLAGTAALTYSLNHQGGCYERSFPYCNQLIAVQAFGWLNLFIASAIGVAVFVLATNLMRRGGQGWASSFTPFS